MRDNSVIIALLTIILTLLLFLGPFVVVCAMRCN